MAATRKGSLVSAVKVASIEDRATMQTVESIAGAVDELGGRPVLHCAAIPFPGDMGNTAEIAVFSAGTKTELRDARFVPNADTPATVLLLLSRRGSQGSNRTPVARINGASVAAVAWTAFAPKAFTFEGQRQLGAGEQLTLEASKIGGVDPLTGTLELVYREVV